MLGAREHNLPGFEYRFVGGGVRMLSLVGFLKRDGFACHSERREESLVRPHADSERREE